MPVHVLLIAPPLLDVVDGRLVPIAMDRHRTNPPYGIYMLASVLREHGHDVTVADLILEGSSSLAPMAGAVAEADLVGIGITSLSWPAARDCISQIRRAREDVPIVLGGIHATMFDHYLLGSFEVDFVIRGEAEVALPMLCEAIAGERPIEQTPSLSARNAAGRVVRTELQPALTAAEIARFPLPDYSGLPEGVYPGLAIESSRGCPFDCCFCSTSYRRTWRALEASTFVDRLEAVSAHLGKTSGGHLQVVDDEFTIDRRRVIRICRELGERGLSPRLVFNARANDLADRAVVEAVAPFTQELLIGAECGYDDGLARVGKATSCRQIEDAARALAEAGLAARANFSFILGLPWESPREVTATLRFACRLYSTYGVRLMLQWYCQIPGSQLWRDRHRDGVVSPALYDDYGFFRDPYLFLTGVSLKPSEISEISRTLEPVITLSRLRHPERDMIAYSQPWVVSRYFPDTALANVDLQGIGSLQEVGCAVTGGRPRREPRPAQGNAKEEPGDGKGDSQAGLREQHGGVHPADGRAPRL